MSAPQNNTSGSMSVADTHSDWFGPTSRHHYPQQIKTTYTMKIKQCPPSFAIARAVRACTRAHANSKTKSKK